VLIIAWPLKRSVIARLRAIATGAKVPPPGAELLASGHPEFCVPTQVEYFLPSEPDRLCVYGTAIRSARRDVTADRTVSFPTASVVGLQVETVTLELRVRVFSPGEDVEAVDAVTGQLCQAVATVVTGTSFFEQGTIGLTSIIQDPAVIAPNPEPSVISNVSLVFTAEVIVP
jgi:hypothetical protein